MRTRRGVVCCSICQAAIPRAWRGRISALTVEATLQFKCRGDNPTGNMAREDFVDERHARKLGPGRGVVVTDVGLAGPATN